MGKKFSELQKGDLIWVVGEDNAVEVMSFLGNDEEDECPGFSLRSYFSDMDEYDWITLSTDYRIKCFETDIFKYAEDDSMYMTTERPSFIPSEGVGLYLSNKEKKPYRMVSDHFMFKDVVGFDDNNEPIFDWKRQLILYEALYDNKDSKEFARHAEDFYRHFTRIA